MMLVFQGVHAEILADETPELDVEGARMCGKTWVLSAKVQKSCLKYPGIWWLICRYSGTETDDQLRPVFVEVCRLLGCEPEWHNEESAYWFPEKNGKISKVFAHGLKTQNKDQRYAKIRGSGVAGLWNDQSEELPEDIGTEMRALVRQPGFPHQLIFSPNPPDEEHFLADQFPDGETEPGRKLYRLSLYDNQHNLPPETISKMEKAYAPTHAKHKSLIKGLRGPNIVGTPVYDGAFDRDIHVAEMDVESDTLIEAFHAGQHHPSWLVCQRTHFGGIQILAGIIGKKLFLEDFLPLVDGYRADWFPNKKFITCCDPPPSKEDDGRFTSINILRDYGLKLRWRENSNSPDVRESVIQNIAGMMKRRLGPTQGFLVNQDESFWLMASLAKVKHTKLFIDSCEGSYVWDENLVSVGSKKVRQPKVNQWLEGQQRCLENIILNCFAGKETEAEKDRKRQRYRDQYEGSIPTGPSSPNAWMY